MPDFTPEPHDHVDPTVPDPIPAPDPVVHSHVDVDALLAAHEAGEHRVFHGWDTVAFNMHWKKISHLSDHMHWDRHEHTITLG